MRFLFFLFFLNVLTASVANCQSRADDLQLIQQNAEEKQALSYYSGTGNHSQWMEAKSKSVLIQFNPVNLVFSGLMALYQNVASPQLGSSCPYELTCSNFSKQAISEFGLLKGIVLSADRLTRCNAMNLNEVPSRYFTPEGEAVDHPERYRVR